MHTVISYHTESVCVFRIIALLPYPESRWCGCVWPSLVAREDCTPRQQWVQPVTHFCLSCNVKWASWFAVEWCDLLDLKQNVFVIAKTSQFHWTKSCRKEIACQLIFACTWHFVTKYLAHIDSHLDILIFLNLELRICCFSSLLLTTATVKIRLPQCSHVVRAH